MEGGIILALVGMVTLIVLVLMGVHIAVALGTCLLYTSDAADE